MATFTAGREGGHDEPDSTTAPDGIASRDPRPFRSPEALFESDDRQLDDEVEAVAQLIPDRKGAVVVLNEDVVVPDGRCDCGLCRGDVAFPALADKVREWAAVSIQPYALLTSVVITACGCHLPSRLYYSSRSVSTLFGQ